MTVAVSTSVPVTQENQNWFKVQDTPGSALIALQVDSRAPTPAGLQTATSMVLPDSAIEDRVSNFPRNLYDLSDTSHLMRLMTALLGDSGAGQLRKRNMLALFQSSVQGSHFYDIDGFYGAIFNSARNGTEQLAPPLVAAAGTPFDPVTSLSTANEWDQIGVADATYRQRMFRLAAAINMGATLPGIQAAAEAIVQAPVKIYEVWRELDRFGLGSSGRSWSTVEGLGSGNWSDVEAIGSWGVIEEAVAIGRTGTNNRSEVVIVPQIDYDTIAVQQEDSTGQHQRLLDQNALLQVLNVIKPAGVLLTADMTGIRLFHEAEMTDLQADSNFWYVASVTQPNLSLSAPSGVGYPVSLNQAAQGVQPDTIHEIPKPAWAIQQQASWSYAFDGFEDPTVGSPYRDGLLAAQGYTARVGTLSTVGQSDILLMGDEDIVVYADGTVEAFTPGRGLIDPRRALGARYAAPGMLVAAPFSTQFPPPVDSLGRTPEPLPIVPLAPVVTG